MKHIAESKTITSGIKERHISPFLVFNVSIYILSAICFMIYTTQQSYTFAEDNEDLGYDISSVDASVTVGTACTFTGTVTSPHTATIANGINSTDIGTTVLNTKCNDSGGYALYAIGYTEDAYGATDLTYTSLDGTTTNSDYNISTGTATSGNTSNWSMKLSPVAGTTTATIENGYSSYNIVPDDYTKVATLSTVTDPGSSTAGSSVSTTYQSYISPTQPAGTYTGKVKYTVVHPSTAPAPEKPPVPYMQTVSEWKDYYLPNIGDTIQAIDQRDNQGYVVTRLADGKIWMTENLNLAGGTEIESELSDVEGGYSLPSEGGFQDNNLPDSGGSFGDETKATIYNSGNRGCNDTGSSTPCYSYYSWVAATIGSGSSSAANESAPYSICPKGWRLPQDGISSLDDWDYLNLSLAYGNISKNNPWNTSIFYNNAGPNTTPNYQLTGLYSHGTSLNAKGSIGRYWSSVKGYKMEFRANSFSINADSAGFGYPVRCLVR